MNRGAVSSWEDNIFKFSVGYVDRVWLRLSLFGSVFVWHQNETKGRGWNSFEVTSLCAIALAGTDLPGGAAHVAAVPSATGLEDPRAGGKSTRSVPEGLLFFYSAYLTIHSRYGMWPPNGLWLMVSVYDFRFCEHKICWNDMNYSSLYVKNLLDADL